MKKNKQMKHLPLFLRQCRRLFSTALLLLGGSAFAFSQSDQQDFASISLKVSNVSLMEALNRINRLADDCVSFKHEEVEKVKKRITLDLKDAPVLKVLEQCLEGTSLTYTVQRGSILVVPVMAMATARPVASTEITGTVVDENGESLPGVTILIKDTRTGTVSDFSGRFRLPVTISQETTLVFSFVGYHKKEVVVKPGESLDLKIALLPETKELEDVVVTGYANIRKSSFTGTSTRITQKELLSVSSGNLLQALQVFDPSLRMNKNNDMGSDPNALPEMYIRGQSGIGVSDLERRNMEISGASAATVSRFALTNNPNLPVFILDGYEVTMEKVYDMDLNRVGSVTVLKDAAATAIYGSRASNGVIVIETIAPQPGRLRVSYNMTGSVTAPDLSDYNMMNAREKLEAEVAAGLLTENAYYYVTRNDYEAKMNNILSGVDTYWLSQPLKTQVNHRHSLYMEGGAESVRFGLGLNYDAQGGVMKKSYRDRMGADLKIDYRIRRALQITNNVSFGYIRSEESPYGNFSRYVQLPPYLPPYDLVTGEINKFLPRLWNGNGWGEIANPLYEATLRNFNRNTTREFSNNFSVNAYLKDFQLRFQFATSYTTAQGEQFTDPNSTAYNSGVNAFERGDLYLSRAESFSWNGNLLLIYNKYINDHNINASLGLNATESWISTANTHYRGFPSAQLNKPKYAKSVVEVPTISDDHSRLVGAFLTGNYTYKDIYLADLSFRTDGSSKFGKENRFAPFWSFGTGINLHRYDFLEEHPVIRMAKIRANYGQTGRVSFSPYAARNTYQVMMNDWHTTGIGTVLLAMGNENLTWDKQNTLNIGLDLNLWNRLNFTFSWYDKRTKNMVTSVSLPSSAGFSSYMENMGDMLNRGMEFDLNLVAYRSQDWDVNFSIRAAHNKNEILRISDALKSYNEQVDDFFGRYYSNAQVTSYNPNNEKYMKPIRKYEEGASVTAIYGMRSLGIAPADGREIFLKPDGSVTYDWNSADQMVVGNSEPDVNGSFSLNLRYKNLTLFTTFLYEWGGEAYNETMVQNVESVNIWTHNVDCRVYDMRWKQPGDRALLKSIADVNITRPTSRFVQKNNSVTFNSLSLAYEMGSRLTSQLGLSTLRVRFEMNDIAVLSTILQERGRNYPFAHTFGIGLNVGF